ncbi:MAG: hypothetical protein AB1414_05070 [bacterium]
MKKEGVLFGIQDKEGNVIQNLFIEITDFSQTNIQHKDIVFEMYKMVEEGFPDNEVELLSIFDLEKLEGKFALPEPAIFPIELFYDQDARFNKRLFKEVVLKIKQGEKDYLPDFSLGVIARGMDFFNQEDFINSLWQVLNTDHIILVAPRRFGKTSLLYQLLDYPKEDFLPLLIDLEGISDGQSFVAEVIMGYRRWIMRAFDHKTEQEINNEKQIFKESIKDSWERAWLEFYRGLKEKILFLFDEFSGMLENLIKNKTESHKFLSVLKETLSIPNQTRFILTGSILIHRLIDEIEYEDKDGFYSLFKKEQLPPLSDKDGYELTQILLSRIGIKPEEGFVKKILHLLGAPIPYFIQLFVFEIEKGIIRENKHLTVEGIEQVYQERLLGIESKTYFRHYYERLMSYRVSEFYQPSPGIKAIFEELTRGQRNESEIKGIFKEICPVAPAEDFDKLMAYLEDEFYIKKVERNYMFTSNLIRDWWLRHSRYLG